MKLLSYAVFLLITCSAIAAGPVPGVEGPFVNFQNGKLVVTMKLPHAEHPTGFSFGVTEAKKSVVSYLPNQEEGGMNLELLLDLDDLASVETSEGIDSKLLDGRDIPGVPGGALKNSSRKDWGPQYADISTYHSPKSFGISLPFNWSLGSTRDGHHWLNWKGKNIGMLSVVNIAGEKKAQGMIFLRYAALKGNPEIMKRLLKN